MLDILGSGGRDDAHKKNLIARAVAPREKDKKYTSTSWMGCLNVFYL